jgi:hypothetical protein
MRSSVFHYLTSYYWASPQAALGSLAAVRRDGNAGHQSRTAAQIAASPVDGSSIDPLEAAARSQLRRGLTSDIAQASNDCMDIDRAMKNPASVFDTPEALSESTELTAEQKLAILLQWKDQLLQLQAADDEGMRRREGAAGVTTDVLGRVTSALSRIDADSKRTSPFR